jgi:hypothetical protein
MWIGAGVTDFLVDRKTDAAAISCETVRREPEAAA